MLHLTCLGRIWIRLRSLFLRNSVHSWISTRFRHSAFDVNNFFKKEALEQVFSREFCEVFKIIFLIEHLWWPKSTSFAKFWIMFLISDFLIFLKSEFCFLISSYFSSRWQMFIKISVLNNFAILTGKHMCWSLFFSGLKICNFLRTAFWEQQKFLKTAFHIEHFRWLLLHFQKRGFAGFYFIYNYLFFGVFLYIPEILNLEL